VPAECDCYYISSSLGKQVGYVMLSQLANLVNSPSVPPYMSIDISYPAWPQVPRGVKVLSLEQFAVEVYCRYLCGTGLCSLILVRFY